MDAEQYSRLSWVCGCGETRPLNYTDEGWRNLLNAGAAPYCCNNACPNGDRMKMAPGAPVPRKSPKTILEEAQALAGDGGERNDGYDHPRENFRKTAEGWSTIFGVKVSERQVAFAMMWLKIVRDNHKPKRDNLVDIAGYAYCAERLDEPAQ